METNYRYLQQDIKTAEKINTIPNFYTQLQLANEYIKKFNIQSELTFYQYLQTSSFSQAFEGITYNDIQTFTRFQKDPKYYEEIQNLLREKSNNKIIQFSKYMNIKKDKE